MCVLCMQGREGEVDGAHKLLCMLVSYTCKGGEEVWGKVRVDLCGR